MPGNRAGGLKTVETIKRKYGDDYYRKLGVLGGRTSEGGGFSRVPGLASEAGRKGGLKSRGGGRRPYVKINDYQEPTSNVSTAVEESPKRRGLWSIFK